MTYIHPLADVAECTIGKETKIWQFVVILKGAIIGKNCNLNAHTLVEGDVIIGDNVTIKSGVYIWNGTKIEDDVFLGPNVTLTNDKMPRSKQYPDKFHSIILKKGCSIGANATLLPGITVGENAMIGAGSVVTKNIPAGEVWIGNPARFLRKI